MPVRIEPHAEPIPGYKLIERLGSGGFGEVWKAEAPGGLHKAIKFVHGDLEAIDDAEGARAGQELKAMDRVRKVRHAYILSIERFEIIEGQLIIVTELADRTLWDRFRECNRDGQRGIPREELLGYLAEAAEALDFMNDEYDLQHLDIKPQNLFLVHKHVKVADFGLAKDLGGRSAATVTGGVTPVYAAPETFDGWLSKFSDQYSLAIVYQELLTGKRPFNGGTMRQLVMQHLQGTPDLTDLPASDQPAIARSLAKNPEARFACCVDLINALKSSSVKAKRTPEAAVPSNDGSAAPAVPMQTMRPGDEEWKEAEITHGARGKLGPIPAGAMASSADEKFQALPPRPDKPSAPAKIETPVNTNEGGDSVKTSMKGRGKAGDSGRPSFNTVNQPALVIGLGKLGLGALQQLRKWLAQELGPTDEEPRVRLLGIDTDPTTVKSVGQGPAQTMLRSGEVILAKLRRPGSYLKPRDGSLPTHTWLNNKLLYRIPRQNEGSGLRALGRLALVDNYRFIAEQVESELQACVSASGGPSIAPDSARDPKPAPDAIGENLTPRVYIVAALGGNTGSGMFLDMAYMVRHILRRMGHANADIAGLFFLPPAGKEYARSPALANAHAALKELSHYATGQVFSARYEGKDGAKPFSEAGPPFQRAMMLTLRESNSASTEPTRAESLAGQFLYRDLTTSLGVAAAASRQDHEFFTSDQLLFQSFGLHRIHWPRRRLLDRAARNLCRRLVERWMTKDTRTLGADVRQWSVEQWDALGLRAENLISNHQEQCERRMKASPEMLIQTTLHPLMALLNSAGKSKPTAVNFGPVAHVMDQLDRLLGIPEDGRPGAQPSEPGKLELALVDSAAAISAECEQKVAEIVVRLIEQPSFRLVGAEECLRQFSATVEQALQAQEHLAKELHERSTQLHERIVMLVERPVPQESKAHTLWSFGRKSPNQESSDIGTELLELLKVYPKCRYQSLILSHINRLYVALRGLLSDQIREVDFCRQRLGELAGIFKEGRDEPAPRKSAESAQDQMLLPRGCSDLNEAAAQMEEALAPGDFLIFDQNVQALIEKECRALVHVCLGPSHVVRTLAPWMVREAEAILQPRLQGESVAQMFLHQFETDATENGLKQALQKAFASATPKLVNDGGWESAVLVVPADPAGIEVEGLVKESFPSVRTMRSPRCDEIILYRENNQMSCDGLEQMGPIAQEAYRARLAADPGSLHTRADVGSWQESPELELAAR